MTKQTTHKRITSNATTTFIGSSCAIHQIVIACNNAGTTWPMRIQDKATPANVLVPLFTLTVPTDGKPIIIFFEEPIPMQNGIDIVTPSGTPGAVDVWVTKSQ